MNYMVYRKKLISFITAGAIAATLIPFTGNEVSAASEYELDKISLSLGEGELLVPGFDAEIPGTIDVSFDRSTSGTIAQKAIDNNKITIDTAFWQLKDSTEATGWADCAMGPVDAGETYRMYIVVKSDYSADPTKDEYVFNGPTTLYVDGIEWNSISNDLIHSTIVSPEYTITSSAKSEYKSSAPEDTNTPTPTQKANPTNTNTPTPTQKAGPTNTNTPKPTNTNTPKPTNTNTPAPTNTNTPVPTKASAQPTQAPADPTTQPAAHGGVSDKIKGAPKNLVCGISKGDARQIDVEFTPDLECGIDQSCGVVIAASTDNQATWQEVSSWSFTGGNKDLKWNTKALNGSSYFKMELEKTYYVKAYYVESDGKKGPDSNICGPFGPVADESKIPGVIEAASKSAVKTTGDFAGVLKKGTTVTFERDLYKLTLTVKEIKGTDVTFSVNLEAKKPYDEYLYIEHGSLRGKDKKGEPYGDFFTNGEVTLDLAKMEVGCTKLTLPVTATVSIKYDRNQKKYKFEEVFNFDVAPQSPSLSVSKADKKSITLGKAYSNKVNCTDSGTTLSYRKKGTKAWKSKTFAKGKDMKITGLSAGSTYEFKAADYVKSKDNNGKIRTIKSNESKVALFRTAAKSAPAIKSATSSKASQKTKKFNGQWVKSGIHMKWQKQYTAKVTSFKLAIKLKGKPAAAGIVVKDPDGVVHVIKGTKATYNLSTEIKGYKKGKTVTFSIATFGNGDKVDNISAVSPYKKVSVRLK